MKSNKKILINKKRFLIPLGYFNSVKRKLTKKSLLKPRGFQVPIKYFETLDKQQIYNRIYIDKIKYLKSNFYKFSLVAAMFVGIVYISNYFENINNNINSDDIINYVNQDILILDNYQYTEILNSNNLNYKNLISEADIENYFVESSYDLKNLIFE
tara:strand:+ start:7761 stop:8228 length:468 start_codon:yes stop_codon:yes gene_type:complete